MVGTEAWGRLCRDQGVVWWLDQGSCHLSPSCAGGHIAGVLALCLLPSATGGALPCVRAVSPARERGLVPPGARSPTCRVPGPSSSCLCRSVAASAGRPPVRGGWLPSGCRPASLPVAAPVGAGVRPSGPGASRVAGGRGPGAPAVAADGGALRRSTAAGDGSPVQMPPRGAGAPRRGGPCREPYLPLERPPSGTPGAFDTGRPARDRAGPPGASPPPRSGQAPHGSPGPSLRPPGPSPPQGRWCQRLCKTPHW
jgi:hypothetical protein